MNSIVGRLACRLARSVLCYAAVLATFVPPASAETRRVPKELSTIQAAIDASAPGDLVLVAPGRYRERLRLKPGVVLRSEGDDARGEEGLRRAEATVLDGGGANGEGPGVDMAASAVLDGFTVTNVGAYDDALWKRHFDSQGEELGDDEGAAEAEGSTPAVRFLGVDGAVVDCIVHHNGDVGIGVIGKPGATVAPTVARNVVVRNMGGGIGIADGAEAIVRGNRCRENLRAGVGCRNARPIVVDNVCTGNVRAGIGVREGARPVLRGNRCSGNRRAGIGIRMEGTSPVVEFNECDENQMAGIGCRDGASPVLRENVCRKNRLAGIGCDGASPLIVGNLCQENQEAGVGLRGEARATLLRNRCLDNRLVAVGITGGASALLADNELSRAGGGAPPIVAIRDGASAVLRGNRITGGGVAGVLVQGTAVVEGNRFAGDAQSPGQAVWIWEGSTATVHDNRFDACRMAVKATKAADLTVSRNSVRGFQAAAIVVEQTARPAHVFGNSGTSAAPDAKLLSLTGPAGIVADNRLESESP